MLCHVGQRDRGNPVPEHSKEKNEMLRRRPVLRTVGRTAVIAGTASVVAGGVNRHQQQKYAQQDAAAQGQAEQAPAPAAPAADDPMDQLTKLANLHEQGILTDEEFSAQKAKILAEM
jgi:membrane protease subunit (stomatin/prohibitin family)